MIVPHGLFALVCGSGMIDFGNASAVGASVRASGIKLRVMHAIFGIEHDGKDVNLFEAKINVEVVSRTGQELGFHDLRGVEDYVVVIILKGCESLRDGDSRYENDSRPVMDQSSGDTTAGGGMTFTAVLNEDFTDFQSRVRTGFL